MTGKSLLPLMRGEVKKIRDFAVTGYYNLSWSIITEEWSYIHWINKMEGYGLGDAGAEIYKGYGGDQFTKGSLEALIDTPMGEEVLAYAAQVAVTGVMPVSAAAAEYAAQRSLDGEAQWTCTPASKVDLPEGDELYFRKDDPFQLNNVIGKNKEIAESLLKKLRLYMQNLDS